MTSAATASLALQMGKERSPRLRVVPANGMDRERRRGGKTDAFTRNPFENQEKPS